MALTTVFIVVLIDLMGFGIVLPLLPFYAEKFQASGLAIGLLYSVYSFSQLIFSPIWGGLSDRIGRRPIMLLSTFGSFLSYILFALSGSFLTLFLSRLLAGIMGGNISTAQSYVADVTTPGQRTKGMGLIGAAFGIGFVVGPALSTVLIHPAFTRHLPLENPYAIPGIVAAALSFLSFLLIVFKLPETVKKSTANDYDRVIKSNVFTPKFWKDIALQTKSDRGRFLPWLLLSMFLLSFAQSSLYSAFPLFCKTVLGLSAAKVGMQFVYMGIVAVMIQAGLIRILVKRISEPKLFLAGNILMVTGLALIPFAHSPKILTAFLLIMAIGGSLNGPTLTSLVSKTADPERVGAMMGTSQGMAALGRVAGPAWGGLLFGVATRLPFLATAGIVSVSILAGLKLLKN